MGRMRAKLKAKIIQKVTKFVAKRKNMRISYYADQLLQSVQGMMLMAKKQLPITKEEQDDIAEKLSALIDNLAKMTNDTISMSSFDECMSLDLYCFLRRDKIGDPEGVWKIGELLSELMHEEGRLMSLYLNDLSMECDKLNWALGAATEVNSLGTFFKILDEISILKNIQFTVHELQPTAKEYDHNISMLEKHLEAFKKLD
ncbi:MAG: hypothetical protein ACTTH5_02765 [Wolinella sp.]